MTFNKKSFFIIIGLALIVSLAYWLFNHFYTYESDAYVEAHVIPIAPLVKGRIVKVAINDLQHVQKGQVLFEIDPKPYQYALALAKAQLASANQLHNTLLAKRQSAIAEVSKAESDVTYRQKEWQRYNTLALKQVASRERAATVYYQLQLAQANLKDSKQQLAAISAQLGPSHQTFAAIAEAKAKLDTANYHLLHTIVKAPVNGYITAEDIHVGDYVNNGQALFGLVDSQQWWVLARIKEAQLHHFKAGARVTVWLKMYPSHSFTGIVYGVGWGVNRHQSSSTASHSILPYLKRTENWVNLQQRFPVRINLLHPNPKYPLRIGASATVFIHHDSTH